jgi:hypothetical protein
MSARREVKLHLTMEIIRMIASLLSALVSAAVLWKVYHI